jgi:hypothetical protein
MEPHLVHHTNSKTAKQVWVFLAHPIVEILRITHLLQIPNFTSIIRSLKSIPSELFVNIMVAAGGIYPHV